MLIKQSSFSTTHPDPLKKGELKELMQCVVIWTRNFSSCLWTLQILCIHSSCTKTIKPLIRVMRSLKWKWPKGGNICSICELVLLGKACRSGIANNTESETKPSIPRGQGYLSACLSALFVTFSLLISWSDKPDNMRDSMRKSLSLCSCVRCLTSVRSHRCGCRLFSLSSSVLRSAQPVWGVFLTRSSSSLMSYGRGKCYDSQVPVN